MNEENFFELKYNLDNMLEDIYYNVISPYLEDINRSKVLNKLNSKNSTEFKIFFYKNSPYSKYISDNLKLDENR